MSIIGIDFGTSLNKIGCINQNIFKIITNNYKKPSTPSVVFLNHKDRWFFGERALRFNISKPEQCVCATKLMLGDISEESFKKREKHWKFTKTDYRENHIILIVKVDGEEQRFSPSEIVGQILKNLIDISKSDLPPKVSHTIISIPAEFEKSQINDMLVATKLANLKNVHFVIEPILASIAYLFNMQEDLTKNRTILTYNLGASFLSVSILQIKNNGKNEITTLFDEDVDIHQIDDELFDYAYKEMNNKYPQKLDFLKSAKTKRKIYEKCLLAKIFQSKNDSNDITVDDEDDDESSSLTITLGYDKFNEINKSFYEKSMNAVIKISKETKIDLKSIDDVFLIGGSTFLIKIREQLKELTGKDACTYTDPREAIALGACIYGLDLSLNESSNEERESIQSTSIYMCNREFFNILKTFKKFNIQTDYSVDEEGNIIYEEPETKPDLVPREANIEEHCNFSFGDYSSSFSSNFSSVVDGHSLSPANSEEEKFHNHKELSTKEMKPNREDSISGKLIGAKNLPEQNSYAVVSIVKQNYGIKGTKDLTKSKVITNSSDPVYDLEFNYEKVKKGHYLMIEIFSQNENKNESDRLIGKSLILIKNIQENKTYEEEFPLKKSINSAKIPNKPEYLVDLDSKSTIRLSLTHKFEYK